MRKTLIFFVFCLLGGSALAQTITGTVKDEKDEPLVAASVKIEGTNKVVTTNDQGEFSIVAPANARLSVSLMGFTTQTVSVDGKKELTIVLQTSMSDIDEVVIIGYQKITRKKNTAAVSSISGKELENLPAASFEQLLQGRLAGVNVQNFTGEPGAAPTVQVRGTSTISREYDQYVVTNQPLYVVDGVPQPNEQFVSPANGTGTNFIAGINPQDIESIDVLRDASAASIYGSRAANGVILVTTKKGRSIEPRVNLSIYSGMTQRPELRNVALGATERREKIKLLDELDDLGRNFGQQMRNMPIMLTDSLNPAFNGNTDWQDMFYQMGMIKNADLSLSGGGNGGMNYRFSAGYYDEEGIVKATGFTRYSMRLNLTSKALREKLMINPIISYSRSERARGSTSGSGATSVGLSATTMPSSMFRLDDDKRDFMLGRYNENLDDNNDNQFSVNLNMGLEITRDLSLTSQSSYMYNTSRRDQSRPSELNSNQGNSASSSATNNVGIRTSNYLTYNKVFDKHTISALGGMDIEYNEYKSVRAGGSAGVSDQIQVVAGFRQNQLSAGSDFTSSGLLSYYTRLSYDYDSRYVFSGSLRTDGSNRFGEENKWGVFPAASVAWLISEEGFMKDAGSDFTLVKLRGSYGTSGNLPGDNYLAYNLYNINQGGYNGNSSATSYNGVVAITPNFYDGVAQPGISWERSSQWNIGTDIEMNDGKYQMSFDIYNKETKQTLFSVNLPFTTGYNLAKTNSVGVRNYGAELVLAANPLPHSSPVKWFSRLNVSYNRNRIMSLPNQGRDIIFASGGRFDKAHILTVGQPINAFYLYNTLGIFSSINDIPMNPLTGRLLGTTGEVYQPGDLYLEDMDGDYTLDPFNDAINPDKLPLGDPNPRFTGGWTNNFTYKNFSLNVFTSFTLDRDALNIFDSQLFENAAGNNSFADFTTRSGPDFSRMDMWRKPGDVAKYPAYPLGTYRYYTVYGQTFFLENASWIRIKSVSLAYDIPMPVLSKWGLGQFKIYGVVDNLAMFQWSDNLPDAENVDYYGEYTGAGYPIPKKFTFGVQVQF